MNAKTHIPISPQNYTAFSQQINSLGINTICHSGLCVNRPECFRAGQLSILVMGDTCTRNCHYCAVNCGRPQPLDPKEPQKIAHAVQTLGLKYVVITSVTRDDLPDQGVSHFASIVTTLRQQTPSVGIELLIPDLWGRQDLLKIITSSGPDVINHNIECTKNRFPLLRPNGNYQTSLTLLSLIKKINPMITSKSGFMVGVGESFEDIASTLQDLHQSQVDIVTIGQYLPPSPQHHPLDHLYTPSEFARLRKLASSYHFKKVFVGPHVRSSYHAWELVQ